jgi:hypothetical protein
MNLAGVFIAYDAIEYIVILDRFKSPSIPLFQSGKTSAKVASSDLFPSLEKRG